MHAVGRKTMRLCKESFFFCFLLFYLFPNRFSFFISMISFPSDSYPLLHLPPGFIFSLFFLPALFFSCPRSLFYSHLFIFSLSAFSTSISFLCDFLSLLLVSSYRLSLFSLPLLLQIFVFYSPALPRISALFSDLILFPLFTFSSILTSWYCYFLFCIFPCLLSSSFFSLLICSFLFSLISLSIPCVEFVLFVLLLSLLPLFSASIISSSNFVFDSFNLFQANPMQFQLLLDNIFYAIFVVGTQLHCKTKSNLPPPSKKKETNLHRKIYRFRLN